MSLIVTVYYFAYYYNLYLSVFLFYPVDKNAEKNELSDCLALRVKPISYSLVGSKNLAVVCRSCWMPGANEVLGCPQNFQTTFFSLFYRIGCHIYKKFAPWMPSVFVIIHR